MADVLMSLELPLLDTGPADVNWTQNNHLAQNHYGKCIHDLQLPNRTIHSSIAKVRITDTIKDAQHQYRPLTEPSIVTTSSLAASMYDARRWVTDPERLGRLYTLYNSFYEKAICRDRIFVDSGYPDAIAVNWLVG